MPRLSFFADDDDVKAILHWLDASKNIRWILPGETAPWRTAPTLNPVQDGDYRLWHRAGGPPPIQLERALKERGISTKERLAQYRDPELARALIMSRLQFLPTCFALNLRSRHRPYTTQERAKYDEAAKKRLKKRVEALKQQYPEAFGRGQTDVGFMDPPTFVLFRSTSATVRPQTSEARGPVSSSTYSRAASRWG